MSYTDAYQDFLNDKIAFFANPKIKTGKKKNFSFLHKNQKLIEQEISELENFLSTYYKFPIMVAYFHYCLTMIETYYLGFGDTTKANYYAGLKKKTKPGKKEAFYKYLAKKIVAELKSIIEIPKHIDLIKAKVGLYNAYRIYWAFCRSVVTNSFLYIKNAGAIASLSKIFGQPINVDKMVETLEAPNPILRGLSVGFFLIRFLMDAALILKHTFFPSKEEKKVAMKDRFLKEFWKHLPEIVNDLVWALINGLTNYAKFFGISSFAAGWITAGFLFFDVLVLLWRRELAEREYKIKKAQYLAEFNIIEEKLKTCAEKDKALLVERLQALHRQNEQLEIERQIRSQTFLFNAAAAFLIATGFSASILFTPAIAVICSYAVVVLGISMYLTAGEFEEFRKQSLNLEKAKLESRSTPEIEAQYTKARNHFIFTLLKNALLPGLTIAAYVICWPAALALTALYLGHQLYKTYVNQPPKLIVSKEPLPEEQQELLGTAVLAF